MEHQSLLPCSQHPPASISSQTNPTLTLQTYFPNIHFEVILLDLVYSYTLYLFYLFTFSLFNDAFSVTEAVQRRTKCWYVNDDLETIRKEAVVAEF
jgi:hypothetical protein